jgi:stage II sporulation protein E
VEQVASLFPEQAEWAYDAAHERTDMAAAAQNVARTVRTAAPCWRTRGYDRPVAAMLPAYSNGMRPRPQKPMPRRLHAHRVHSGRRRAGARRVPPPLHGRVSRRVAAGVCAQQLAGVSRTILSLSENVRDREWPIEGAAQMLCRRLERDGYRVRGALVHKRKGCMQAQLKMADSVSNVAALEDAVSRAVECPMRMLTRRDGGHGKILEFEQARGMKATLGAATLPMGGSIASGDSTAYTSLPDGRALFALSDGMGSGSAARSQSAATLDMLCRLYETGFERATALECVNRLLMQHGGQDMYATVDALHINLANGAAEFIKFGAPPSFVLREGQVHTVYAEALPAGILDEAAPAVHAATLRRNDSVVLLTDGALDALGEDTAQEILSCVGGANTCEEAARSLLAAAKERGHADDMSVLVVRME